MSLFQLIQYTRYMIKLNQYVTTKLYIYNYMLANKMSLNQLLISSKEKEDFWIIACLYFILIILY